MKKAISLLELNQQIKKLISVSLPDTFHVIAEISDLRINRSGHCYLELVEKDSITNRIIAKSRAMIWSNIFRMLRPYFETTTGRKLESGLKILVEASVEFHEMYGLSLTIIDIDPTYTLGDLARIRQEIITQLTDDGIIDMNKQLDFPALPRRIAVISSDTAAGYGDFSNQLKNNPFGYKFYPVLFPSYMQGDAAVQSIINALEKINEKLHLFDIVVIIRGGGSRSDLSCFDNYELAFNIAQFPLPVLTGIGHERDESITDIVAFTALKTPTAVAEFLVDVLYQRETDLKELHERFIAVTGQTLEQEKSKLKDFVSRLQHAGRRIIYEKSYELTALHTSMARLGREIVKKHSAKLQLISSFLKKTTDYKIEHEKLKLNTLQSKFSYRLRNFFKKQHQNLEIVEKTIQYQNPERILEKGYSLTFKNGKLVKNFQQLTKDDEIETQLKNGKVKSIVKSKKAN